MNDRIPRSETEERAILGILLYNPQIMDDCIELAPEDFYVAAHGRIYRSMQKLWRDGVHFDLPALWESIKDDQGVVSLGGAKYVARLLNDCVAEVTAPKHVETIKTLSRDRTLLEAVDIFRSDILNGNAEQAVSGMQAALADSMRASRVTWSTVGEMASKRAQEIEDLLTGEAQGTSFLPTGIPGLDAKIAGWAAGDLIYIAARPSVGKTAAAIQSAVEVAQRGHPVAFGSAEMSRDAIMNRILAYKTRFEHRSIRQNDLRVLRDVQIPALKTAEELYDVPMYVDDRSALRPADLWWLARKCERRWGSCAAIFCDYIQLMRPNKGNESKEREVSSISADLKAIAKDLNVPVIALSQLGRDVEKRVKKGPPMLSDLKWSGDIEQDADEILFLWTKDDTDRDNIEVRLKVGKQRNGPLGTVYLRFDKPTQTFAAEESRYEIA